LIYVSHFDLCIPLTPIIIDVCAGLRVTYNNRLSVLHGREDHGVHTGQVYEFNIAPHERITESVVVRPVHDSGLITSLKFKTNTGSIYGPYGVEDDFICTEITKYSIETTSTQPMTYLAYLSGDVYMYRNNRHTLRYVQFIWAYDAWKQLKDQPTTEKSADNDGDTDSDKDAVSDSDTDSGVK